MINIRGKYLTHIGVKGMKWGVRRLREEGGEIVLKKGQEVHSVMSTNNITLENGRHLYVSFTRKDVLRYQEALSQQIAEIHNVNKVFDHTFKTAVDLVSPTKARRIEEVVKMYKDDPDIVKTMGENKVKASIFLSFAKAFGFNRSSKSAQEYRDLLNSKDPKDKEKAFQDFASFLPLSPDIRKAYFTRLSKKGFNSIYDDNDIYKGMSDKPLIIFDQAKSLTTVASKEITSDVFVEAYKELQILNKSN